METKPEVRVPEDCADLVVARLWRALESSGVEPDFDRAKDSIAGWGRIDDASISSARDRVHSLSRRIVAFEAADTPRVIAMPRELEFAYSKATGFTVVLRVDGNKADLVDLSGGLKPTICIAGSHVFSVASEVPA